MMNRSGAWYQPQTAHAAKQWVAMANMATPCSLSPLYLPSLSVMIFVFFFHSFAYLCLSPNISPFICPCLLYLLRTVSFLGLLVFVGLILFLLFGIFWRIAVFHFFFQNTGGRHQRKKGSLEVQYTEGQLRWLVQALDSLMIVCLLVFDNFSKSAVHVDWLRTERTIRQMSASNDKEC